MSISTSHLPQASHSQSSSPPFFYTRYSFFFYPLFFLRRLLLLGLERLLPITPDHDDGKETADDGRAEDEQDDGDADCPDAW
jgi:hypothetical protein